MKTNDKGLSRAARLLRDAKLVAFPTETVYGLGADATDDYAVAGIFEAKGRPSFNPLIVHLPNLQEAQKIADFDDRALRLAENFWPGALTLVVPLRKGHRLSRLVSAGLDTVALRVPAHGGSRDLLRLADRPIAAPSANLSGRLSPTSAAHVATSLDGRIDLILDGGPCKIGLESSIVDCSTSALTLLRPGGVPPEAIEYAANCSLRHAGSDNSPPRAPGMLSSHYAPQCPVRLNVERTTDSESLLGFGPVEGARYNLSPGSDLREAAGNLFKMLHLMDSDPIQAIAVSPIPEQGLGLAINDRLRRAAAPRN